MDIIRRHNNTRVSTVKRALVDMYDQPRVLNNIPLFCVEDVKIRSNESKILNLHVSLDIPNDIKDRVSIALVHGLGIRSESSFGSSISSSDPEEPVVSIVGDPLKTGETIKLDVWNCTSSTIYIPAGKIVAIVIIPIDTAIVNE
jgi:hypothetical protein